MTTRKYNFVYSKYETILDYFKDEKEVRIELKKESNGHVNFYYKDDFLFSYYATTGTIHCDLLKFRGKNCSLNTVQEVLRLCLEKIRDEEKQLRDELEFHSKKAREIMLRLKNKGEKSFKITMSNTYYVTASDKDMARDLFEKRLSEGRISFRSYNNIIVEEVEA